MTQSNVREVVMQDQELETMPQDKKIIDALTRYDYGS